MKAIVIGASSGIGRELAKILVREGYEVGVIARRRDLLISLQEEVRSPYSFNRPIFPRQTKQWLISNC